MGVRDAKGNSTLPDIKARGNGDPRKASKQMGERSHAQRTSPTKQLRAPQPTPDMGPALVRHTSRPAVAPMYHDEEVFGLMTRFQAGDQEVLRTMLETQHEDWDQSRRDFEQWLYGYDDLQSRFVSAVVCAEMKYKELLQLSAGMATPGTLRTAGCAVLLDRLLATFSRNEGLVSGIRDDILSAIYRGYSPEVLLRGGLFERTPFFLQADELDEKNRAMTSELMELREAKLSNEAGSKVIKTVAERELERMMWIIKKMGFQSWTTFLTEKKHTLEKLKGRMGHERMKRIMRQLFAFWKLETLNEMIWKGSKEISYLEQQVEILSQEDPDHAKKAREEARKMLEDDAPGPTKEEGSGGASHRPPTLSEQVCELYHTSRSAKPFALQLCIKTIAELIAQKVQQDDRNRGRGLPLQSMHMFCRDFFLRQVGMNGAARKRLHEFIQGVRMHANGSPLCKVFGRIVYAMHDPDENPMVLDDNSAHFFMVAITAAIPRGMVKSRLLAGAPTLFLADCMRAAEVALTSEFGFGEPRLDIWNRIRKLGGAGLLEEDLEGGGAEDKESICVSLFAWLDFLMDERDALLQMCRDKTYQALIDQQKMLPKEMKVMSLVRFTQMMTDMKEDIDEFEIVEIYNEVADLTGRHQDRFSPACFFEVCRKHRINYMGPA